MKPSSPNPSRSYVPALLILAVVMLCAVLAFAPQSTARERTAPFAELTLVAEHQAPGRIEELSGIYPHPQDANLYYAVANQGPVYRQGDTPKLPLAHRGKLLTVTHEGKVLRSTDLVGGDYGDLAWGDGHLFIASLEPAEILKFDLASEKIVARFPLPGPAGGLEFDAERGVLYAQLFVGHPQLAVIDAKTGAVADSLWSDESAMGLAKVKGDLLCTWSNGFTASSFSELRLLDPKSGRVLARQPLDGVHTSLAPTADGFLSLVLRGTQGDVVVRRYTYTRN